MKKICLTILIISLIVAVAACETIDEPQFTLADNISYQDTHLYTGESTHFSVSIARGNKENTFVYDGKADELIGFTTIKITPLHMDLFNKQYSFKLKGDKGELTGELSKDMFGVSFSSEIENIDSIGKICSVVIIYDDIEDEIELTNKLKDMIEWNDVLAIAEKEFENIIRDEKDTEAGFQREIHIKFINNRTDRNSPYYWYVSFISSSNDYWAILVDPETGSVISKKS